MACWAAAVSLRRDEHAQFLSLCIHICMNTFWAWLIEESRQRIEPAVLAGYERAFKDELLRLIQRTADPVLRKKLVDMIDCPVRTASGCRGFADYIYGALVKNGLDAEYDLDAALQYVVEKMLMDRSEVTGGPKASLFTGFSPRPGETPDFNPLQARFMVFLQAAIGNIRKGKIARLRNVERRPPGAIPIGLGRHQHGDEAAGISPDEIADRPHRDADLGEMIEDISDMLRRKEPAYGFPLVALFRAIMSGVSNEEQRRRFGDRKTRAARQAIVQTVEEYARSTGNATLLHLLDRLKNPAGKGGEPVPTRHRTPPTPVLSDRERDYRSLASVVARFNHPIGTAQFGSYRRRWLEYPPRNPSSGHRNRLEEVLAAMVADGVLRAIPTGHGATVYAPGPDFDRYGRRLEAKQFEAYSPGTTRGLARLFAEAGHPVAL